MTVGAGAFTITRHTHIVAKPGSAARVVADDLAAYLRPATGYPLPVTSGPGRDRDIRLELGDAPQLTPSQAAEGYVLDASPHGVNLAAETAHAERVHAFRVDELERLVDDALAVEARRSPSSWCFFS